MNLRREDRRSPTRHTKAIGFTAELSHYPSRGRYATLVGIDAAASTLSVPPVPTVVAGLTFADIDMLYDQHDHYYTPQALPQPQLAAPRPLPTLDHPSQPPHSAWDAFTGGTYCGRCYVDEAGVCVTDCTECPPGQKPNGECEYFTKECPDSQHCCPSGQEPCYAPSGLRYCCPPDTSCCDGRINLCCASGESCGTGPNGVGTCCPGGQAPTAQGCCPEWDVPCGDQCCTRALPPGSNAACCNGRCTDTNTDPNNCGGCGTVCPAPAQGGATCVGGKCSGFVCGEYGLQKCGSECCCAIDPKQVITAPALGGSKNYLFTNITPQPGGGCDSLQGLKVALTAKQNMVSTVVPVTGGSIPNGGFSFQLNAYNPASSTTTTSWMQYVFLILGNAIRYQVQYWDLAAACGCCTATPPSSCPSGCNCGVGPVVNLQDTVLSLPSNTIPAGYVLEIELENNADGNVAGALFSVTDNAGKTTSKLATLDPSQQLPIVAFEANVVGPANSSNAQFAPNLGQIATITYASGEDWPAALCAEGGLPDVACNSPGTTLAAGTAEQSNVSYDTVGPPCCNAQLTQSVTT
jgi:hypothetical protein